MQEIRVRFQAYEFDLLSGELWKNDAPVRLQPQPAKVLRLLVERAGQLVSREDIQKVLWEDETFVDFDQGLNYCIRQIRIALEDNAEQPLYVATIPRRGYRFVAGVSVVTVAPSSLSYPDETQGMQPVGVVYADPDVSPKARLDASRIFKGKLRGLNLVAIGAVTVFLLVGLLYVGAWQRRMVKASGTPGDPPTGLEAATVRTSVAVLGFANLNAKSNDGWLSTAFSEMLSTELSEGEKLRLVSAEEVARARRGAPLPESLSGESLRRLRQELGSDVVVLGSYAVLAQGGGRKVRLDVRLQDARSGQMLAAFAQTGDESDLFGLVTGVGTKLRQRLGTGALSEAEKASLDRSFPADPEARRLYAEGLERLRAFDALGARQALEDAAKIEPRFAPVRSALAAAWSELGYDAKAAEEARRAFDLAGGLPREEQLSAEARYYEMAQDRAKAVDKLRMLVSFFPDDMDYGIRMATLQTLGGQNDDALATLANLRKLPEPLRSSPRLDLLEAQIRSHSGDFKQSRAMAENAVRKGRAMGAQLLVAQGLLLEASALERLGLTDLSLQASSEARQINTDASFPRGVATSLLIGGDVLYDEGKFDEARSRFENALSIFQEIGDKKNQGQTLQRIGNVYHDQGKLAQSQNEYSRALELYREIHWLIGISSATGSLANTLDALGDLAGSLKMHLEVRKIFEQIGNERGLASEIDNIAFVQEELGNLPAAAEGHRQALAMHKQTGHQRGEMYAVSGLGDVFLLGGDFDAARKQFEAARTIGEKTGEDDHVALFDLDIATADFLQNRLPEAETRVRRAVAQFQKAKDPEANAEAYALLVRVLLAENRLTEAVEAGELAVGYAEQVTSLPPQFEVGLASAHIETATGKREVARRRLLLLLERARKGGYLQYSLEIRRSLAGLETGSARKSHLTTVADEARRKGFGMIAAEVARMPEKDI